MTTRADAFSAERVAAAKAAYAEHGSIRSAAAAFGMSKSCFHKLVSEPVTYEGQFTVRPGHVIKGESALLDPQGNVQAIWVKTREDGDRTECLVDSLKEAFEPFHGRASLPAAPHGDEDLITVYPIPDLHFGMYSWLPETGSDYDTDIAARIALQAMSDLVSQSRPTRYAVVLGLGDYFHANDRREVTMASGHKLDMDGRWMKVISEGTKLARRLVDMVASKHANTEAVFIQGNHDPDASVALTVAMSLFYANIEGIKVTENANIMWHRMFGKNLLAATHGHTMKPDRFAMAVACDYAKMWGAAEHRHGFMGHIHHETAKEVAGMRIESFQTPAAKDSYAAGGGYRAGRSMSAITFHKERGEVGRHRVNINQVETVSQ